MKGRYVRWNFLLFLEIDAFHSGRYAGQDFVGDSAAEGCQFRW